MSDVSMRIMLSVAGTSAVSTAMQSVGKSLSGLSSKFGSWGPRLAVAGEAALGVSMAVGAIGIAAVSTASQFQTAMLANEAHAGLAASQVQNVNNALLQMGPAVGQGPTQLAQALYPILSGFSGISNQAAKTQVSLAELKDAAMSVAGTTANVTTVSNAATAAFNAFGLATNNATTNTARMNSLFDTMNATVSAGNMQWSDYANVVGKLSVSSRAAGVSFIEANSALADLTNSGYSARLASTYLGNTFTDLYLKTATTAKNAKSLGLSFNETKYQGMDLAGKIAYLNQVTGGNQSELLKLLNGNSVALKTFDALSNTIGTYKGNLQSLGHAQGTTAQDFQTASQGFGFSMQKLKAFGQSLLITIGTPLLNAITGIVNAVIPAATAFVNWATHSKTLQSILHSLGTAFSTLGGWVKQVAQFFEHNAAAMTALKVVGIAFLGAFMGLMIAGFVALAIAAGSAAIGVIAATWPFLAIGAAIALVIAVVVLLVQHWGQLVSFFQGVWNNIVNFFRTHIALIIAIVTGPLGALVVLIVTHWNQIKTFFAQLWHDITTSVGNFFSMIGTLVQNGLQAILNFFLAPFRAIGALFEWLYAHNIYFQRLVDAIRKIIGDVIAFLKRVWTNIVNEITGLWHGLVNTATNVWNTITGAIHTAWNAVVGVVTSVWQKISGVFTNAWTNYVSKPVSTLWSNVTGAFGNAWNTISQKLSSLWSSISGWFGNLASQAIQWGANLISGFLKGVQNALGGIGKTLGNVGSSIASYLGFHSPTKEGPGREADQWAPNLMKMYAQGLQAGIPQLQASLNMVMRPVVGTLTGGVVPTSGVARPSTNITHAPVITINLSTMARSQSEVRNMVDLVEQELGRRMRSQTPSYNSGNIF